MTMRLCLILFFIMVRNPLISSVPFSTGADSAQLKKAETTADCFTVSKFHLSDTLTNAGAEKSFDNNTPNGNKWLKAAYVPAGLITAGLITMAVPENTFFSKYSIKKKITETYPGFSTTADNYLQFVPGLAVFGLKAAGLKSRSDLLNQSIIMAKSELLTLVIVQSLKNVTHIQRPNGNGYQSMPSGHTAQAFQLATIFDMEYRDVSPWISVSGYTAATATGILRMLNNKHWISDVLVGAGTGIFTTKFVYLTHQYRWGKNSKIAILPAISNNGGGIVFALQL